MDNKSVFNAAVCIIGIAIMLIHIINIFLKKNRRKDENNLLIFIAFTMFHFVAYLTFTLIKDKYASNELIMGSYTVFYVMNNVQLLLLFVYTISYVSLDKKAKEIASIINYVSFAIFVILDIVNVFTPIFFYAENGIYMRTRFMIISQIYQFIAFGIIFIITVFNKKLGTPERIAFTFYCLLPLVAILLQNALQGYAIAYLSIIVSIEILFLFVNVKKNIALANEAKKSKETEIKMMMSQIQPHFIYNTLASISTLIKLDPDKAQKALDDFTEYVRNNFSALTSTRLIPFKEELRHVETYLSLEKMRFGERLNVAHDVEVADFMLPPLVIQPLVENAVKHGIMQKIEGGTITIKTREYEDRYEITIEDDGVGFDMNKVDFDSNKHVGLNNIKYRLSTMVKGKLDIQSEIDKGTTSVITLYK